MATAAGLKTAAILDERGGPAAPDDTTFVFWLQPDR